MSPKLTTVKKESKKDSASSSQRGEPLNPDLKMESVIKNSSTNAPSGTTRAGKGYQSAFKLAIESNPDLFVDDESLVLQEHIDDFESSPIVDDDDTKDVYITKKEKKYLRQFG